MHSVNGQDEKALSWNKGGLKKPEGKHHSVAITSAVLIILRTSRIGTQKISAAANTDSSAADFQHWHLP
jgi:hypothetical protein